MQSIGHLKSGLPLLLWAAAIAAALPADTLTTLYSFGGRANNDGAESKSTLVEGRDGNLYGTTAGGGLVGGGTVFRVTLQGDETVLIFFCYALPCIAGIDPSAGLLEGFDGNFYGVSLPYEQYSQPGAVFEITPGDTLTVLHAFNESALGTLNQASDGNFYGTTADGGTNKRGSVFEVSPAGAFTTLYSFCSQADCADGAEPTSGLIQASDGNLYGSSANGLFKITLAGALSTLYSFQQQIYSASKLLEADDGNFYGTTYRGGANDGGTVFKITREGTFTTVYSFCSEVGCADGVAPYAELIQATDGNLYGTTSGGIYGTYGGTFTGGTVFKVAPDGTLTTVYRFCPGLSVTCADGSWPVSGLVQAKDDTLYGTTYGGGAYGSGTIFKLELRIGRRLPARP
jgi:uncharacterized repeat protein (TIGR03803 family)